MSEVDTGAQLAPEVQALLVRMNELMGDVQTAGPPAGTLDDMRQAALESMTAIFTAAGGTLPDVPSIQDHRIAVAGGAILVRVYSPEGDGPFPAFMHVHGGGWMMGSIDWPTFATSAREVCLEVGCVVAAVEYRLAPEVQFPVPGEEAYSALLWMVENAEMLNIDPSRIAVGGDAAGAQIAAQVCMMARDSGGPALKGQVLENPALDQAETASYASASAFGAGCGLELEAMQHMIGGAFPEGARRNPQASPVLADDLSGLPPAHIMTAEFDLLRDCGELYGELLKQAGVPTTVSRQAGHIHGSCLLLYPGWEPARAWRAEYIEAVRQMLTR